ncbi:MAG TPA: hypothetical protein VID19_06915 [Candidatus Eremiobacteraceae bacterium]
MAVVEILSWIRDVARAGGSTFAPTPHGIAFTMPSGRIIVMSDWKKNGFLRWNIDNHFGDCQPPFGPEMYPDYERGIRKDPGIPRAARFLEQIEQTHH